MGRLGLAFLFVTFGATVAQADTILRLSETGRVTVHPDEMAAVLTVSANSADPAVAQAEVNAAMARAVATAQAVPGSNPSTGGYSVWHQTQPKDEWRATQSLNLRGQDAAAVQKLVGALQAQHLTVSSLGWQLSQHLQNASRSEATTAAVKGLRARADEAAGLLGLHFDSFREVNLDGDRPVPFAPRAFAASAAAGPPPVEVAADVTIEATVTAEAVLKP